MIGTGTKVDGNDFLAFGGYTSSLNYLPEGVDAAPGVLYLVNVEIVRSRLIDVVIHVHDSQTPAFVGGIRPGRPEDLPPGAWNRA